MHQMLKKKNKIAFHLFYWHLIIESVETSIHSRGINNHVTVYFVNYSAILLNKTVRSTNIKSSAKNIQLYHRK